MDSSQKMWLAHLQADHAEENVNIIRLLDNRDSFPPGLLSQGILCVRAYQDSRDRFEFFNGVKSLAESHPADL